MLSNTYPCEISASLTQLMESQHGSILNAIAETRQLYDEHSGTTMLIEAVSEILDSARIHFREEEDVLRESRSVAKSDTFSFEAHQALHKSMLGLILTMRRRTELFDRHNLLHQLFFLDGWLRTHISNEILVPSQIRPEELDDHHSSKVIPQVWISASPSQSWNTQIVSGRRP